MVSVIKNRIVRKLIAVWLWVCINHITGTYQLTKNGVLERSIRMYNNPLMSDIKFTYRFCHPGQELYAHKYMLATSSRIFQEMFYGDSPTKDPVIELPEIDKEALEAFLAYLYKDECPNDIYVMFKVLGLTQEYEIPSFHEVCKYDLEQNAPAKETVMQAFERIEMFLKLKEYKMIEVCWGYIDRYTEDFFASEFFLRINVNTLTSLLTRDTLSTNERTIFKAVVEWADYQCLSRNLEINQENRRQVLGDAIYEIRFHTMAKSTFSTELSRLEQLLSYNELIRLQKVINGEKVPNLKWDSSKQKRETLFGNGILIVVLILFISVFVLVGVTMRSLYLLTFIFFSVGYFYPHFAIKLVQSIMAKLFSTIF